MKAHRLRSPIARVGNPCYRVAVRSALFVLAGLCAGAGPATLPATKPALVDNVRDAKGLDSALEKLNAPMRQTEALSPAEAQKRFKLQDGYTVDLIAAEPDVRQPLCINFDERGRMWVVQYIQYPFPADLKVVEYDKYIRAKFDKVPAAPPHHAAGKDVITILEDVDRDGSFRSRKTFVSGLSIATSALPGRGGRDKDDKGQPDYGVWVMNAPYLLFYPDRNRDDVPDSDPIVHLSGFGIEDTHAVASSLTWGPDGWLYGTQGSTCTAKVKAELAKADETVDFQGQAIWRYHPETHRFEIFAEGGGNTFGLEFDDAGRAFSGTNWGKYRGLHFVQGGYYIKGWGKHGPLTNPFAFGFFDHMPHEGNADRLCHTMVVYGESLLGPNLRGKIISPNSLQSRIQVTRLEPWGSTYKTVEEPYLMTTEDGWFRPVDLKSGPDGAIYIADFYEKRISHVDPRDTWDRANGRIWRIRPTNWKPKSVAMDLMTEPAEKLVERLKSENRWERAMSRRVMGEKGSSRESVNALLALNPLGDKATSLAQRERLWVFNLLGYDEEWPLIAGLRSRDPVVRAWSVRLAGDVLNAKVAPAVFEWILRLAVTETDRQVLSQLAITAKRLPGVQSIALIRQLLLTVGEHASSDPHLPLLVWWAIESKATSDRDQILESILSVQAFGSRPLWMAIVPRLARRYAAEPTSENQKALATLLTASRRWPEDRSEELYEAVTDGLDGAASIGLELPLVDAMRATKHTDLGAMAGDPAAFDRIRTAAITSTEAGRSHVTARSMRLLAIGNRPDDAAQLLFIAEYLKGKNHRLDAITALSKFNLPTLGADFVKLYQSKRVDTALRTAVLTSMLSRPAWTMELLRAVESGAISRADFSSANIESLRQFEDPAVVVLVEKVFGKAVRATDAEKAAEVDRVMKLVTTGTGDAVNGKALYTARCAACHTLFNEGGKVGPELTGYDRQNAHDMVMNVVDPSAYIREEFASFRVKTKGGEAYVGLITERSGDRLTIIDAAQQKTTVAMADIADERAMTTSLMPEGLLAGLSEQEVRDLFKYISLQKK